MDFLCIYRCRINKLQKNDLNGFNNVKAKSMVHLNDLYVLHESYEYQITSVHHTQSGLLLVLGYLVTSLHNLVIIVLLL